MIDKKWSYPTLYTERLILRKIDMSDILHIFEYASDNKLTTYTVWDEHQSLNDTKSLFIKSWNDMRKKKSLLLK